MKKKDVEIKEGEVVLVFLTRFGNQTCNGLEGKELCLIEEIEEKKAKTIKIKIVFVKKPKKDEEKVIALSYSINFPHDARILKITVPTKQEKNEFMKLIQEAEL